MDYFNLVTFGLLSGLIGFSGGVIFTAKRYRDLVHALLCTCACREAELEKLREAAQREINR